jgi:putative PIN family toxin of toxin-antitoxin system
MRVVLDTNVVVSAFIWQGTPFKLLEAAARGDIKLFCSAALMAELSEVLTREHLAAKLIARRSSVHEAIATYAAQVIYVTPAQVPRVIAQDADDDQVVACALAANADLIVSGDKHLHSLGSEYQGIRIALPSEALRIIEDS